MRSSRLKNFCEVCRKQCKDENGYHCHINSAVHQNKLRELATNPEAHIEKYSKQLENRIMQMLKVKYPGQPKNVQDLYQEYTQEKHYVRFNHTRWRNLEEFVEHLRKNGRNLQIVGKVPNCKITYLVSKSSDFIKKKREEELFDKKEKQKEMLQMKMEERVARNKELEEEIFKQMKRKVLEEQEKLQEFTGDRLELTIDVEEKAQKRSSLFNVEEAQKDFEEDLNYAPKKVKNLEKLFDKLGKEEQQRNKKNQAIQDQESGDQFQWIMEGITVKVLPHQIPEAFHGKKTAILGVKEPFVASVQIGSASLNIDQTYLETVIPKIGNQVMILRGEERGSKGILQQIDIEKGIGNIELQNKNTVQVQFNFFSKCA